MLDRGKIYPYSEAPRLISMAAKIITLSPEVRSVLEKSTIASNSVKLPLALDRSTYLAVNKALESAGGKWNTKAKVHLFSGNPREALGLILEKGVFAAPVDPVKLRQQQLQAYYTPAAIARELVALADVRGRNVLEPSCGPGALVRACVAALVRSMAIVEVDLDAYRVARAYLDSLDDEDFYGLSSYRRASRNQDFLTCTLTEFSSFDRVVMNPPFADGQDFLHIRHALQSVTLAGGTLTSIIMGDGNVGALATRVRKEVAKSSFSFDYKVWPLPENSFKASGTGVNTAVIQISNLRHRATPEHVGMFLPLLDWSP